MSASGKSGGKSPPVEIEMQELPPRRAMVETQRGRRGSFSGQLVMHERWTETGTTDYYYSASMRTMEVRHIQSHVPGGGSMMMAAIEERAKSAGAQQMLTATSRPGFFKKVGFDYTPGQQQTNAKRELEEPGKLARDENNKDKKEGSGYEMFKTL